MTLRNRQAPSTHAGETSLGDRFIVLQNISWEQYVAMGDVIGEESNKNLKMVYLEGTLELMTKGPRHEAQKKTLGRLIELYALERDIDLYAYGEMTRRSEPVLRGLEPDECYLFGRALESDSPDLPPDLAIEVTITSGYVDKLEVYRGLEVPEVWFWKDEKIEIYRLLGGKYVKRKRSGFLPDLDVTVLARFAAMRDQPAAVRAFREWLRGR